MQLTNTVMVLACAGAALAQTPGFDPITKPTKDEVVSAGLTYQIQWTPGNGFNGTVTIGLLGGASPDTLQVVETIASGVDNAKGSFDWAVETSLGKDKTYGIQIKLERDTSIFQYSFPFSIKSGGGSSTSSSSSSSSTSTLSSSSSSATGTTSTGSSTGTASSTSTGVTKTSSSTSTTVTSTHSSNLSTTASGSTSTTAVTLTTTTTSQTTSGSASRTSTVATPTAGAGTLAASSFALLGGLAMAVLAF